MKFELNQTVELVSSIFKDFEPSVQTTYFSDYPNNISIAQDAYPQLYLQKLAALKFDNNSVPPDDYQKVTAWQVEQSYRILNAAIASANTVMKPYIGKLLLVKEIFEKNIVIQNLLSAAIDSDIVCAGDGHWFTDDGYITLKEGHPGVMVYTGFGASMSPTLGVEIENNSVKAETILIEDDDTGEIYRLPANAQYPEKFINQIPNLSLEMSFTEQQKSRVIEISTGRILWEIRNPVLLSDIISTFPSRIIHWACCLGVSKNDESDLLIGPFAGYTYQVEKNKSLLKELSFFSKNKNASNGMNFVNDPRFYNQSDYLLNNNNNNANNAGYVKEQPEGEQLAFK